MCVFGVCFGTDELFVCVWLVAQLYELVITRHVCTHVCMQVVNDHMISLHTHMMYVCTRV